MLYPWQHSLRKTKSFSLRPLLLSRDGGQRLSSASCFHSPSRSPSRLWSWEGGGRTPEFEKPSGNERGKCRPKDRVDVISRTVAHGPVPFTCLINGPDAYVSFRDVQRQISEPARSSDGSVIPFFQGDKEPAQDAFRFTFNLLHIDFHPCGLSNYL